MSLPPEIIEVNGTKHWYINDKRHREDGPAIEYANGRKEWYLNGKLHREDGPAIISADGRKEWYLYGNKIKYNPATWNRKVKENQVKNIMNT